MEIRELRAFVTVVEEGALSAAARRLHVSQSALSQTMRSLERQLGVQLLERNHTGVRPTDSGQALLRGARALLAHHDDVVSSVAAPSASLLGRIRVGVPLEFPIDVLPTAMAGLADEYPDTNVDLMHASSAVQLTALRAGELNVALVRDRPTDPSLDAVLAVRESLGVILTTGRSEELSEPAGIHLHRLAGLEWIAFTRAESPAWYDEVSATLRGHGVTVPDQPDASEHPLTTEVKLAATGTGRAFAFASPKWAQPLPDNLAWHPLIGDPIVRRTWAIWRAAARERDLAAFVAGLDSIK
ncbi:MAG TPA: LysR family transcriptional regulator [Mycobacterium sp.]|nr:LysR family transcriptional regulator [Mycobacterium sp.]